MMRNLLSPLLLAMGLMVIPLTSARADQACSGPWQKIEVGEGRVWGQESSCRCQLNGTYVRGGVLASSFYWGYLWSEGKGTVRVVLEMKHTDIGTGMRQTYMETANGKPFEASNGSGIAEEMFLPRLTVSGSQSWTGFYRSECIVRG